MDAVQVPQGWVNALFTALVGLCLWIFRKVDRRVDKIEAAYVSRAEINALLDKHNARVEQMHTDNTRNFSEIRVQLEGVNTKLFELNGKISK